MNSALDSLKILMNSSILFYFTLGGFAILLVQFLIMVVGMIRVNKRLNLGSEAKTAAAMTEEQMDEMIQKRSQAYVKALEKELEERGYELEEKYQGRVVKINSLLSKLKSLASTLDKNQIFRITLDMVQNGILAEKGSAMIIDHQSGELLRVRSFEKKSREEMENESIFRDTGPESEDDLEAKSRSGFFLGDNTLVGTVAAKGGILSHREALNRTEFRGMADNGPVPTRIVGAIEVKGKTLGVLHVESTGERELTQDDEILFATICSIVGLVMDSAHLFELTHKDLLSTRRLSERQVEMTKMIRSTFERFISPKLVEEMLENPDSLKLGGERRMMTVFFSDIRGFTTYSERHEPEHVVSILNEYLTAMTDIVLDFDGTLDKFVGDEIMAIWGAPVPQENHAVLSVLASIEMLRKLQELQASWRQRGIDEIDIGMGINTGDMVVGNMGSLRRMDYTVIGDNVNIGARLEALTRQYDCHFIISESTYSHVSHMIDCVPLQPVTVKGKTKPIMIYCVLGLKPGVKDPRTGRELEPFVIADDPRDIPATSIGAPAPAPERAGISSAPLPPSGEQIALSPIEEIFLEIPVDSGLEPPVPASSEQPVSEPAPSGASGKGSQVEVLEGGMQKVVCPHCSHPNVGKTIMYCEKCGRPV